MARKSERGFIDGNAAALLAVLLIVLILAFLLFR